MGKKSNGDIGLYGNKKAERKGSELGRLLGRRCAINIGLIWDEKILLGQVIKIPVHFP